MSSDPEREGRLAEERDLGLQEVAPAARLAEASKPASKAKRLRFWTGQRPEPLPSFLGPVEEPKRGKLGICCSGGGIRSAAFNLGALQILQKEEELKRASYLSAVSGGSYIAAAFCTVAKAWEGQHRPQGPRDSGFDDSNPEPLEEMGPFAPGSPEEQYLRNRCSYMAPTAPDKSYLVLRVVLGLLLNLLFVALPLIGGTLILVEWVFHPAMPGLFLDDPELHLPFLFWFGPALAGALGLLLALLAMVRRWGSDAQVRGLDTWAKRLIVVGLAAGLVLVVLPVLAWLLNAGGATAAGGQADAATAEAPSTAVPAATAGGIAVLIAGVFGYLREVLGSPLAADAGKVVKAAAGLSARLRMAIAYTAAAIVGPLVIAAIVVYTASLAVHWTGGAQNQTVLIGALVILAAFAFLYGFADITATSLHGFYKRRLSTVFSLKRVLAGDLNDSERARQQAILPSAESGIAIERDFDHLVPMSETALQRDEEWPTLIVCAAANISDVGATPPGRRVTSFTFSAATIGGPLVGAAPITEYGKVFDSDREDEPAGRVDEHSKRMRDVTLPAAVAMSGAAISPSMGAMTQAVPSVPDGPCEHPARGLGCESALGHGGRP